MKSTTTITVKVVQLNNTTNYVRGSIKLKYNDGSGNIYDLDLRLTQSIFSNGRVFREVAYGSNYPGFGNIEDFEGANNNVQAINYITQFNNFYKNIAGNNNIKASLVPTSGNQSPAEIKIEAEKGFFVSASYTGDVIDVNFQIDNAAQPATFGGDVIIKNTGNCNYVDFEADATGEAPFSLVINGLNHLTNWDGSIYQFELERGKFFSTTIVDNFNQTRSFSYSVPRKLKPSEFDVQYIPYIGGSDIEIIETNPLNYTSPIEYAIADNDGSNKSAFQVSNSFTNIINGSYRIYIKDRYGCEVFKNIVIAGLEDPTDINFRQLGASAFNSLSFSKPINFDDYNKKNHQNTLSVNENIPVRYKGFHDFVETDFLPTQFWSSYPFMIITLFKCDGTKQNIPFQLTQKNLGTVERVDCKIFPIDSKTGVYFDGGNEYEQSSYVVKGASPHTRFLPDWANVGQQVLIVTVGVKIIESIGYDEDLQRNYFTVSGTIGSSQDDVVEVIYNRQKYNLYTFFHDMANIEKCGWYTIEAGFSFDAIESYLTSEPIRRIQDTDEHLLIEWEGYKNIGNMVYTNTSMTSLMRIVGNIRPYPTGESETIEGDDRAYSLIQNSGVNIRANIPTLTFNQWDKINKASTISKAGKFTINGLELVRNKEMEHDELGSSNYSNVVLEFDLSGENASIKQDEIVTNPSTGIEGNGGNGDDFAIPPWDGKYRLSVNGTMIRVNGFLITLD